MDGETAVKLFDKLCEGTSFAAAMCALGGWSEIGHVEEPKEADDKRRRGMRLRCCVKALRKWADAIEKDA
jgi:hypothetical protein